MSIFKALAVTLLFWLYVFSVTYVFLVFPINYIFFLIGVIIYSSVWISVFIFNKILDHLEKQ